MKITFRIHYNTKWGERIAIIGNRAELGQNDPQNPIFLEWSEGGFWTLNLEVKDVKSPLSYRYLLVNNDMEMLDEDFGQERSVKVSGRGLKSVVLHDTWRSDQHPQNSLQTSAFSEAIFKQKSQKGSKVKAKTTEGQLIFRLNAPRVKTNEQIVICGNIPVLGAWDFDKALHLENEDYPVWTSPKINPDNHTTIEYKYGIYDTDAKRLLYLEAGVNRVINNRSLPEKGELMLQNDEYFNNPNGNWKGAGVATPVFSLRSKHSFGVGEFTDLQGLIDWSDLVGLKMVQILPVNDTNATGVWTDSYPYAAISVFALHPQYLSVASIAGFKNAVDQKAYKVEQKMLNDLPEVDYEKVMQGKLKYARQIFEVDKLAFLKTTEFQAFMSDNEHWLKPYAAFCYLRDLNGTADFNQWKSYNKFSAAGLKKLINPKAKSFQDIAFWYFVQYHLDLQLKGAGDYARSKGIILKGDIPIGIYRYSADAWTQPELYNMNGQSGAPPDPFSEIGQNWGFPTYNWEEMAKDGFQWWKNRFTQLSRYFDAFRIDHILGFFRIWQIPVDQVEGSFGFFNPALPVRREEFAQRGIWFDYDRLCRPHIRSEFIIDIFGAENEASAEIFFETDEYGKIRFRPEYDTQRKVEAYFKENPENENWKKPLFGLLANVLFFEVPGSNKGLFHPRIEFLKTSSFQELPPDLRPRLEALYNDYFYNRQEEFWHESAMRKLPAIRKATNMLICGEDLGMVPACVPGVMEDLSILTLEIQRMSKNPETEFLQEEDIPYLSVASPSTHDMSPLRLWWEEMDYDQRNRFFNRELHSYGEAPATCTPDVAKRVLQQHLHWRSMWIVFPLQDIFAINGNLRRENPEEERINVPANPQHYWRFRFHVSNEDLMVADEFNEDFARMVMVSGR